MLFYVDKDTEYELNISPKPVDVEQQIEDTTIHLDTSEYNASLEALEEPKDALEAYIETIYFDLENVDYEKYVTADKNSLKEDAENLFSKLLSRGLSNSASASDVEKYYESFRQASGEVNEIETKVKGNANDKAIVVLNYSAISDEDISKEIRALKEKYRDKHDDYDTDKEDEYALSKFDSILNKLEATKSTRELEVHMKKQDGKWMINDTDMDYTKRIMSAFSEGVVM